jgi:oligopeptide/dipeptide ABC transporter ATP-binding protein
MPLLKVNDLKTIYRTERGDVRALEKVSFEIDKGVNFGLVGESGCGKTTLLKSIIGVLPSNAQIVGGKIFFEERELTELSDEEMRPMRWNRISMITQSAMNALDPVFKVGEQIIEALETHRRIDKREARAKVEKMFALVGIDRERFSEYPHQFSGGMRQRAIIAMSLILEPSLVIADEPTTSLDVIVQDQIFKNINKVQNILRFSMFLVTHDISLVIENCDEIGVMYAGKIMEIGEMREVIKNTYHPYTMGLKNSFPNILNRKSELISIPGVPPNLIGDLRGCRFYSRCPFASELCSEDEPPLIEVGLRHQAACHHIQNVEKMREMARHADTWLGTSAAD